MVDDLPAMTAFYRDVLGLRVTREATIHGDWIQVITGLADVEADVDYWDGEQLQSIKRRQVDQDVLPLDAFRAEFMGRNWDVPAELLWYANGPFTHEEALSMALLHDGPMRPLSVTDLAVFARLWRVRDAFGCGEAVWVPYWESDKYVAADSPTVKVSLHHRPGKGILAVVANTTREDATLSLRFDLATLGQPGLLQAVGVLTDKVIPFADGRLEMTLKGGNFTVVWLQAK